MADVPGEIVFGEFTADILQEILEKETPSPLEKESQSQDSPIQPLPFRAPPISHQLWFSMMPKPPRKPPQLSRIVSPMPTTPKTLTQTTERSYVAVPSQWCIDNRVGSRATYLSRNPFLRKMFPRRLLYRRFEPIIEEEGFHEYPPEYGVKMLGDAMDYWVYFPLKPPDRPECAEPPRLEDEHLIIGQEITHAWITGMELARHTLDRAIDPGSEPIDMLAFPWATNIRNSTKIFSLQDLTRIGVNKINGFVKCPKCGSVSGISCILPLRFAVALHCLVDKKDEFRVHGEEILQESSLTLTCLCDGKENQMRPFISKDWKKINWLFLVLGCEIGHCTKDQLRYFCREWKLKTSGSKIDLLLRVCENVFEQLHQGSYSDPVTYMQIIARNVQDCLNR